MDITIDKSIEIIPEFDYRPCQYGPGWFTLLARRPYWATVECAQQIAKRYGAALVAMPPYYPYIWRRVSFAPDSMPYLRLVEAGRGFFVNAGILADIWQRYVVDAQSPNPDLADKYCLIEINEDQADQKGDL